MHNDLKKEELKEFIVQIKYNNTNFASGVILKIDEHEAYIFTVKHLFKHQSNEPLSNITLSSVEQDLIVVRDYWDQEIKISQVLFLENTELDMVIFKIDDGSFDLIQGTKRLELYMGEFNTCAIAGYPKSRKGINSSVIQMSSPDEVDFDGTAFELKANEPLNSFEKSEMETIKGMSGSGVFKRGNSGKIFLLGIQYAYIDTVYLKCLDLRKIIQNIENKINIKVLIGEYPFFEELGIDTNKLNFKSMEDMFLLNKDIRKIKKNDNEYDFLREDNRANRNLEKSYQNLKKNMKEMADIYFYQGKVFFESEDRIRAYQSFSRAIELFPEYKIYFGKDELKKEFLTDSQKRAREKLKDEIILLKSNDGYIYEKVLLDNIKTNTLNKNYDALEKDYRELIIFYTINFFKYRLKIIDLLKKLSKIKLFNKKPLEAEDALIEAKEKLTKLESCEEINKLLVELYTSNTYIISNCTSSRDTYFKLLTLKKTFSTSNSYYTFITNKINELNIHKVYDNDCFIEHMESQRREIDYLKNKNHQYLNKINLQAKSSEQVIHKSSNPWWFTRWLIPASIIMQVFAFLYLC